MGLGVIFEPKHFRVFLAGVVHPADPPPGDVAVEAGSHQMCCAVWVFDLLVPTVVDACAGIPYLGHTAVYRSNPLSLPAAPCANVEFVLITARHYSHGKARVQD